MADESEIWRPIPGFENYEVSNLGRVRNWKNTRGRRLSTPRMLSPGISDPGYPRINLRRDGKTYPKNLHVAVLEAFVGPCPPGYVGCHHPDPDKRNCRLSNLRWATYADNERDKKDQGRYPMGERHYAAKLSDDDVRNIRALVNSGIMQKHVAAQYGIARSYISQLCAKVGRRGAA